MNSTPHMVISVKQLGQTVAQNHVVKSASCSIGRAWDNDVVLADPKCPDYIGEIRNDSGHLSFHSRQSKEQSKEQSNKLYGLLQSGEKLAAQYTNGVHIYVYLSNHPLTTVQDPSVIQRASHYATSLSIAIIALTLSIGFDLWNVVQRQIKSFEWYDVLNSQLMQMVSIVMIAFVLAAITKFVKQEKRFSTYVVLISTYMIVIAIIEYISRIAYFNYPSPIWGLVAELLSTLVALVILIRIVIDLMSFWNPNKSWALAIIIGLISFYNANGKYWLEDDEFSKVPLIITEVFPNYLRLYSSTSVEDVISQSDKLFDKVDEQRDKD